MPKHIVMTGGTGLIGRRLTRQLLKRGDRVTVLTRNPDKARDALPDGSEAMRWLADGEDDWPGAIDGADAVVHLAGESIAEGRWTDAYKQRMYDSRINTAAALMHAVAAAEQKPEVFTSVSAVGYYGDTGDREVDEDSPPGNDFLAELCVAWEAAAYKAETHGLRVVTPRMGLVLARNGGALDKLLTPFKMFAGGPVGNGQQWFPWIHIDDAVGILLHALDTPSVSGPLNAVAPGLIRNREFAVALGEALKRPAKFSVPAFVIKLAMGELGEMLLGGQRAHPRKTLESGYTFTYADIDTALRDLVTP
ncbi:MAG: TIGR01777 family oxidoreductase [Bacteroidetes bacterium]|nr:TIGR01777 family oxidoreductase [Bacteroidota bacterium]